MVAKDPALAELIRSEQDLSKQINAQLGTLNNVLALASAEREENGVRAINASIDKLRGDRDKARAEITRRFPSYADLIDPKPPTVEAIRDTLREGEALLSFYFGRDSSFVWAVPKQGPVSFVSIAMTAGDLESKVRRLREALELQVESIFEVPAFDLALAHELYSALLKPVEAGWKSANSLIVVTNGALGLLPLVAAADRPCADQGRPGRAVRDLSRRALAGPHPCRHHGAVGGGAANAAAIAGGVQPARAPDRVRRSIFQRRAARCRRAALRRSRRSKLRRSAVAAFPCACGRPRRRARWTAPTSPSCPAFPTRPTS